MTNTLIFKENLKIITNKLIDTIWKEKIKSETIQQTIQKAFCSMYRGGFEEIKELDEEHLYNSWVNSCENTERMLTDPLGSSQKINSIKNIIEDEKPEILFEEKENKGDLHNSIELPKQDDTKIVNLEIPKYYYQNFGKTKKEKKMSPPKNFLKEEPKKNKSDKKKVKSFFCRNKDVEEIYMPEDEKKSSKGSINKHNSVDIKPRKKNNRNLSTKIKKLENEVPKHGFDLFENQLKSLHFKTKSEESRNHQMKKLKKRYNKSFKHDFNEKKMFHSTRNPLKYLPKHSNLTSGSNNTKKNKNNQNEHKEVKNKLKKRIKKLFKKKKSF